MIKTEFLKFLVLLANATNCQVIAEGIEQESEYKLLSSLGIKLVQGYFFEKPSDNPHRVYRQSPCSAVN